MLKFSVSVDTYRQQKSILFLLKQPRCIHLSPFSLPDVLHPLTPRSAMLPCGACFLADPVLFSSASPPYTTHPGTGFCASQQLFSHRNCYRMSAFKGFSSSNLNTTRAIYEPTLRVWNLLCSIFPASSDTYADCEESAQLSLAPKTWVVKVPANTYFIRWHTKRHIFM